MEFSVVQGDIAAQSADALVNAAGTSLRMGSGVAGALRRTAGGPINDEAMSKGPVDLGEVAVTDAYDLDAEYVIHAAAMPHYGDGRATGGRVSETRPVIPSRKPTSWTVNRSSSRFSGLEPRATTSRLAPAPSVRRSGSTTPKRWKRSA